MNFDGLEWPHRTPGEAQPDDFKSNILCTRHNTALSHLDLTAGSLFRTAAGYHERLKNGSSSAEFALFDGETVERWMLKTLWGFVASKAARTNDNDRIASLSPRLTAQELSEHLFRGRPWPFEWGLHTSFLESTAIQSSGTLALNPYLDEEDRLVAIGIEFGGISLRIGLAVRTEHAPNRRTQMRPAGVALVNHLGAEKIIAFGWPGKYSRPLVLEVAPPQDSRAHWPAVRPSD